MLQHKDNCFVQNSKLLVHIFTIFKGASQSLRLNLDVHLLAYAPYCIRYGGIKNKVRIQPFKNCIVPCLPYLHVFHCFVLYNGIFNLLIWSICFLEYPSLIRVVQLTHVSDRYMYNQDSCFVFSSRLSFGDHGQGAWQYGSYVFGSKPQTLS